MSYQIGIIGTGNVAWHLARAFENAGHVITDIYNRDISKSKNFALDFFNAHPTNKLNFDNSSAQIFILAVSDDAIVEIAPEIILPENAILVHTSGSVAMSALGYARTENQGVFYPLQTFSKGKAVDFSEIPIGIEAENNMTENALNSLAKSVSNKVQLMDSRDRRTIHLAAVFACNFTNHLFTISKGILENRNLNFGLLEPLIIETLSKSLEIGPNNAQTGPAKRGDFETLDKHFQTLSSNPDIAEIYRSISQNIIDFYAEE
ncbi:Rossmann-like and DUF2520 domain-containing protein [Roseivirga echinicomitans]|uniref:Glycerol-3-phosphate dehydrogenase n=1 Tax=Roseivirga echinicomitans TaxID=296218 RepID=A0A150XYY5_9BACT|nr:Rossmann-like and DUF2520 domain-containing protein [Roseivirga echinicomitans]KYG83874.1 glycerol-3-phosphate dehydrogenase [Roseivirga echinicomitans]